MWMRVPTWFELSNEGNSVSVLALLRQVGVELEFDSSSATIQKADHFVLIFVQELVRKIRYSEAHRDGGVPALGRGLYDSNLNPVTPLWVHLVVQILDVCLITYPRTHVLFTFSAIKVLCVPRIFL